MSSGEHRRIRLCAICKKPIPDRPLQSIVVRACGPQCASRLAHQDDPTLGKWDRGTGES